jgi:hypothetical protein
VLEVAVLSLTGHARSFEVAYLMWMIKGTLFLPETIGEKAAQDSLCHLEFN